jgi:hypothetical protein
LIIQANGDRSPAQAGFGFQSTSVGQRSLSSCNLREGWSSSRNPASVSPTIHWSATAQINSENKKPELALRGGEAPMDDEGAARRSRPVGAGVGCQQTIPRKQEEKGGGGTRLPCHR